MAGELKYSAADDDTVIKTARATYAEAFCDGRAAQVAGVSSNPYPSGSAQNIAWQSGHDTVAPEGLIDNCALAIPITTPNLSGLTSAAAQAAIANAKLAVGHITGTTGTVTVQSPDSAVKVQPHTTVAFTIA